MKFLVLICVLICAHIFNSTGLLLSHKSTKAEGCVSEGACGTVCQWETHRFFPGDNRTLYRDKMSTCHLMTCREDFFIEFEM